MNLFDLEAVLTLNSAAYEKGLLTAENSANTAGNNIANTVKRLVSVVASYQIGKKLVAFGKSTIDAASSFESAFTGVRKTVDATEEEFTQLSDWIMEASTKMALSKEGIAGTMEIAGQLGISGVESLKAFTETMVMLGDTTNLNAEEAAGALARFMNITGDAATDVSKIGSVIVDLGNNFATTEADIVSMATRLASAGTIAGLSSTDILALSTAMSSVGIQAEAGGTAMTQTLVAISKAVSGLDDTTSDAYEDLVKFATVSGMSAEAFAKQWKDDPVVALQAFIKGLDNVNKSGENVFSTLGQLGLSGIRQTNMLQSLALASDMLGSAVETASNAFEENNALVAEAEKRYGTMESRSMQASEAFKNLKVTIGNELLPVYSSFMDWSQKIIMEVQKFVSAGGLTDIFDKVRSSIERVQASFSPLAESVKTFFSKIDFAKIKDTWVSSIGKISEAWQHLKDALQPVIDKFSEYVNSGNASNNATNLIVGTINLLATAFSGLINSIATVIDVISGFVTWLNDGSAGAEAFKAIVIALTAGIAAYNAVLLAGTVIKNSSAIASALLMAKEVALQAVTNGLAAAQTLLNTVMSANPIGLVIAAATALVAAFTYLWKTNEDFRNFFIEAWGKIKDFFKDVGEFFGKTFENIKQFGQDAWDNITNTFSGVGDWFKEKWETLKNNVKEKWDTFKEDASQTWERTKEIFSPAAEWFKQKWTNVRSNVQAEWEVYKSNVLQAWERTKEIFAPAANWFKEKWTNVKDNVQEQWGYYKENVKEAWNKTKEIYSAVDTWFKDKFTAAKDKVKESWDKTKENFSTAWSNIKYIYNNSDEWFSTKFEQAKNAVFNAWSNIKSLMSEVWERIKDSFRIGDALSWGKDMIDNFIAGIKSKIQAVKDAVSSVASTVKEFLGFSEPEKGPLSNFHTYAPDMMNLFIEGIKNNQNALQDAVANAFDFQSLIKAPVVDNGNTDASGDGAKGGRGNNYYTINVNQPVTTAADMLREIRTEAQYGLILEEAIG